MKELLERLGRATGPDRNVDVEVAEACGITVMWTAGHPTPWIKATGRTLPEYTASIDAALTLVPAGVWFKLERDGDIWSAWVDPCVQGYAHQSAALAVTYAALCARPTPSRGDPPTSQGGEDQ